MNLFLVFTTGLFFNKVNQAESVNDNLALLSTFVLGGDKSCLWIKKVQGALFNSAHPKRVVNNCDLSVTNIRRVQTLIGLYLLYEYPACVKGVGELFSWQSFFEGQQIT